MLRLRRLLLLSVLAAPAACDPLLTHPGEDFQVSIRTPMPLTVSQQVGPAEILFEVSGCSDFDTSIGTVNTGGSTLTVIEPEARGNGLYAARVPAAVLAEEIRCYTAATEPARVYKTLSIRCRDQRRETSANVEISYAATFQSFYSGRGSVDAVLPGQATGSFFTLGSGWLSYFDGQSEHSSSDTVTTIDPQARPRLVQRGDSVFLFAGCPAANCGNVFYVDTPTLKIASSAGYVIPFAIGRDGDGLGRGGVPILVPLGVSAMKLVPSTGDIALVSSTTGSTILTLIGNEKARFHNFDGEALPSELERLGNMVVFLTTTPDGSTARLRTGEDGSLVGEYRLEGTGPVLYVSLAPSGDQWLYARSDGVRLATLGADRKLVTTRLLQTQLPVDDRYLGATWLTNKLGLWSSAGDQPPELHSRGAVAEPVVTLALPPTRLNDTRVRSVRTALGLDASLAVVTPSGVEIFDETGHSLAGADPFDSECGRPSFGGVEVAILDGQTIAVGGTSRVSLFRPSR